MKKVIVLGGFLGSGKTTFVLQLARYLTGLYEDPVNKVVLIENEIGEVGIDNQILSDGGISVKNLFAGCVCCSISGELEVTVKKIIGQLDPDYIILESTGLAYPKKIKENLEEYLGLSCTSICMVDASRWLRLLGPMGMLLPTQLDSVDFVLLNKTDLVKSEEQLTRVEASVKTFNSTAVYHKLSSLQPVDIALFRAISH